VLRQPGIVVALAMSACSSNPDDALQDTRMLALQNAMSGELIERLPSGLEIRDTYTIGDRTFGFVRKVEFGDPFAPESSFVDDDTTPPVTLDDISDDDLAEWLRPLTLVYGEYEYLGVAPEYDLALKIRAHHELIEAGLEDEAAEIAPNISPSELDEDEQESADSELIQKTVFGTDDRIVGNNTTLVGKSTMVFDNTNVGTGISTSEGTGILVGLSTALSAAHVFWDEANNTWEPWHRWAPGYDSADGDASPYGEWFACYNPFIPQNYVNAVNANDVTNQRYFDFAVLEFSQGPNGGCNNVDGPSGNNSDTPSVGHVGAAVRSASNLEGQTATTRGYPASGNCGTPPTPCATRQWVSSDTTPEVETSRMELDADITVGQSGSGVYQSISNPPQPCVGHPSGSTCIGGTFVVATFITESASYNLARTYNSVVHNFLLTYSAEY
jgi:V8-like Glu-specific endopeptidase